jgi:probable rRNA maturation factor
MPDPRVRIQNRQRSLRIDARALGELAGRVLAAEAPEAGLVGVVLVRDRAIAELNARYLGHAGATDVLAFPASLEGWPAGEPRWLGEVVVSVDRAREQARERGLRSATELRRLIVHGILHLCGHGDATPRDRARMRRIEGRYLRATRSR